MNERRWGSPTLWLLIGLLVLVGLGFFVGLIAAPNSVSPAASPTPRPSVTPLAPANTSPRPVQSPAANANPNLASPNPPALGYAVVTARNLNLRKEPNTSSPVLGQLNFGDIVPLAKRDNGWYQTDTGAWISASYVEVRQTLPEAQSYQKELRK